MSALTSDSERLQVAINAEVVPWKAGGIAQALMSLIRGLGELDGKETYRIIVNSDEEVDFWRPALGSNQELLHLGTYNGRPTRGRPLEVSSKLFKSAVKPLGRLARRSLRLMNGPRWPEVPISNGFYESLDCHVVHFPWQKFVVCAVPTIFNPHDLQHLHYPQYFTPQEIATREAIYRGACRLAQTVVVGSEWAKKDVVRQFGTDPGKVQVVLEGSPAEYWELAEKNLQVKQKYQLPDEFIFYPGITWPHKNHLRLLDALAWLRNTQGRVVRLVCAGTPNKAFQPQIERRVEELQLQSQVQFLGYVPEREFRTLYRLAKCLIFPSLFEASSLPVFEAWLEGLPVACSNATALPEQVRDAALLFDPSSVPSIARAIDSLVTDPEMCELLKQRGFRRVKGFTWVHAAKSYRALYRRAASKALSEEDRWLLSEECIQDRRQDLERQEK